MAICRYWKYFTYITLLDATKPDDNVAQNFQLARFHDSDNIYSPDWRAGYIQITREGKEHYAWSWHWRTVLMSRTRARPKYAYNTTRRRRWSIYHVIARKFIMMLGFHTRVKYCYRPDSHHCAYHYGWTSRARWSSYKHDGNTQISSHRPRSQSRIRKILYAPRIRYRMP